MSSVKMFATNKGLVDYLKDSGSIKSDFVYGIMCSVDRKNFIGNDFTCYTDKPQLVAYGKTISAPHMHAKVLEHLSDKLRDGGRALDIGSGSGYLTTCMAMASRKSSVVIGMDCIPGFQDMAQKIVRNNYPELLSSNQIEFVVGDGKKGYPIKSPYKAIHVGLAASDVPQTLLDQLAPGGCLIMPIGDHTGQVLCLFNKSVTGVIEKKQLCHVRYGYFENVNDMNLLMSNNDTTKNQITSTSHDNIENNRLSDSQTKKYVALQNRIESFEKVLKNSVEKIEKRICEFQTEVSEKVEVITSKLNKQYEKRNEEILKKIDNVEINLKDIQSNSKVFNDAVQTKFKEYNDHMSGKLEIIDQRINKLSDNFEKSKNFNDEQKEKEMYSDNLAKIEKICDKFSKLFEDHKIEIKKANTKWNECNQQLQNVLNKFDKEHAITVIENSSMDKVSAKSNSQVDDKNRYEALENKLSTLTERIMKQNEKIDIHEKILEIQIGIFQKEQARKAAKKNEKQQKIDELNRNLIGLNQEIQSIEFELKNGTQRKSLIIETTENTLAK